MAVGVDVAVGVAVGVGPDCAQYLPPVFEEFLLLPTDPPQTMITLPVQTAVCECRAAGALVVLVVVQLSVSGVYLPPVSKSFGPVVPPHTIISLLVQTVVCSIRPSGALVVLVAIQLSVLGLYLPPVFSRTKF